MAGSEFVFLYSTFPDAAAAARVGEALVRGRLAACVNICPPMQSIYEWDGKVEIGNEVAAIFKTRRERVDEAIAMARPLHPYSMPCFLVLPIEGGNADYLAWARQMTGPRAGKVEPE